MSIFKEIPPTAGFPLHANNFLSLFRISNWKKSPEQDFKNCLNVDYAEISSSGTAAFYLILENLKTLSPKKTVIIPSFVCPLVALAIKRAGLNIEVCDINKNDFNFDKPQLENLCSQNQDVLAIVAVHLGGIPVNLDEIKQIAQKRQIFVIEDCAQALGAQYKGKRVGALADFAFFSLCRGKGLTIYEGGVLVTNNKEYAEIARDKIRQLVKNDFFAESLKILELLGYWIFYRPSLFWFVFRLPQIFWNFLGKGLKAAGEEFGQDFPVHSVSRLRKIIGRASFYALEREINQQREKAAYYLAGLKDIKGITVIMEQEGSRATYPYLTLIFDEMDKREEALRIFKNSGLGVSIVYACAIIDYDYLKPLLPKRDCPNGRYLAQHQITLSTSTFLKAKDLEKILDIIRNLLS